MKIKGVVAAKRTWNKYLEYCQQTGRDPRPRYSTIGGFLCRFVARQRGSTRSVAQVKSQLKSMALLARQPWLSARADMRLRTLMRQMVFEDTSEGRQMTPLRTYVLNKVISRWDLSQPTVLLEATIAKTAQQGLMRGAEVTGGLKARDMQWRRNYRLARLHLWRTKRGRSGAGQFVTVAHVDNDRFAATKLLRRTWVMLNMDANPDGFLFPAISRGKIDTTRAFTAVALRALVKRIAREAGFSDERFGNHSLRAGGATDLLAAGVPDIMVQKMGRWESETYKIYFRDDRAVAEAAAKGFNKVARSVVW